MNLCPDSNFLLSSPNSRLWNQSVVCLMTNESKETAGLISLEDWTYTFIKTSSFCSMLHGEVSFDFPLSFQEHLFTYFLCSVWILGLGIHGIYRGELSRESVDTCCFCLYYEVHLYAWKLQRVAHKCANDVTITVWFSKLGQSNYCMISWKS